MRTSDLCPRHLFVGCVTANVFLLVSLHMLEMFIGHDRKSTDLVKKVAVISRIGVKNNILQAERRKKNGIQCIHDFKKQKGEKKPIFW